MTEKRTCKQCNQPFTIFRNNMNRHAAIRFCGDCKDDFKDVLKGERPSLRVISTKPSKSRQTHLATN